MSCSGRVPRLLYQIFAYYAIFIGATSYRYDFRRRLVVNTKWTQLIASVSNLIIFSYVLSDLVWVWSKVWEVDEVTGRTIQLDSTVNDVVYLVRLLQRVQRERATRDIHEDLNRLGRIYPYRWAGQDRKDMRRLRRIYLAKNIVLWLMLAAQFSFIWLVYHLAAYTPTIPQLKYLLVTLLVVAQDGQDATMHVHFLLSWRICRFYMRLNSRVRRLLRSQRSAHTLEFSHLRWQHVQLAGLMERLTVAYDLIMCSTRLSLLVTAAALGYYISVFHSFPLIYQLVGFGLYAVLALNGYILDLVVDWTVQQQREAGWLLRRQLQRRRPNEQLSRGCDLFALQLACFPLQIRPYGLFPCGTATWLSNNACIVSWMVVLLQYRLAERPANRGPGAGYSPID